MDRTVKNSILKRRLRRKNRIRKKIRGTAERPRVSVFISNKNVSAQVIDDDSGKTLVSASTVEKGAVQKGKDREAAKWVGSALSEKALGAGIKAVVFDRNGYRYHGKVKELAEAMREKGLSL